MFERSSNPLRPCFAGDENFRVFIHDDDDYDGPREVVTFFQRHSPVPLFIVPSPRFVSSCLFISPRTTAANVSSKQFFENTFGALKVAPFPPLPPVHETKDAARRPCFSPNRNTVTRLPWVCACMCVYVCEIRECTLRGGCNQRRGEDGRVDASVYLAFCLASEGGKGSYCWVAIVLDVVHIGAYLVFIFLKRIERDNGVIVLIIFV